MLRQNLLKYFAALSLGLGGGDAVARELSGVPPTVLEEFLDEMEQEDVDQADRLRVLTLLCHDLRAAVRGSVLGHLAALPLDAALRLTAGLATADSTRVRGAAAEALARLLTGASGLERTAVVSEWATSQSTLERLAIATVLAGMAPVLGGDSAIEQLCADEDVAVRRQATRAACSRLEADPKRFGTLLLRLAGDRDEAVRTTAQRYLAA